MTLALATLAPSGSSDDDVARLAGGVYAANTVGAIVGSMVTSFVLIPWIGSQHTQQVLVIVSAVSALLMLEPSYAKATAETAESAERPQTGEKPATSAVASWNLAGTAVLAIAMVAAGLLALSLGFGTDVLGGFFLSFPPTWGVGLGGVYAAWLFVIATLYPACLWFADLKERRKDWWLYYL